MANKNTFTQVWQMKTKVENHIYENVDFTGTDFNHPIFQNVVFKNCTFKKCNLDDTRLYSCNFYDCVFDKVDLRGATIGAHGGDFKNCVFKGCNFQRQRFHTPRFYNCIFDKCKLKGWEPQASYFENCKIIGHLIEVVFYNNFYYDIDKNCDNLFHSIDFSQAIFGEYIIFENCDLSKSTPPNGYTFDELLTESYSSNQIHGLINKGTPSKFIEESDECL